MPDLLKQSFGKKKSELDVRRSIGPLTNWSRSSPTWLKLFFEYSYHNLSWYDDPMMLAQYLLKSSRIGQSLLIVEFFLNYLRYSMVSLFKLLGLDLKLVLLKRSSFVCWAYLLDCVSSNTISCCNHANGSFVDLSHLND